MASAMQPAWDFETAALYWIEHRHDTDESAGALWDAADDFLFSHEPRSLFEADFLIVVVQESMAAGGRSDGEDIEALAAVRRYLRAFTGERLPKTHPTTACLRSEFVHQIGVRPALPSSRRRHRQRAPRPC